MRSIRRNVKTKFTFLIWVEGLKQSLFSKLKRLMHNDKDCVVDTRTDIGKRFFFKMIDRNNGNLVSDIFL